MGTYHYRSCACNYRTACSIHTTEAGAEDEAKQQGDNPAPKRAKADAKQQEDSPATKRAKGS